jgi:hypothetical protein
MKWVFFNSSFFRLFVLTVLFSQESCVCVFVGGGVCVGGGVYVCVSASSRFNSGKTWVVTGP